MVRKIAIVKQFPGGVLFVAPAGTPLPTDASEKLNEAFKNVADLNEDGITRSTDVTTTDINNMSGEKAASFIASYEETFQFVMLETNAATLSARYGKDRVTSSGDDVISFTTGMPKNEHVSIIADLLLSGMNKKQRIVIPDAVLTDTGDLQYHSGDAITYDVTFSTFPDKQGNNSYNYFADLGASQPVSGASSETNHS
nr:MAG TPA: tail protein [Caudoviricetes sp.]